MAEIYVWAYPPYIPSICIYLGKRDKFTTQEKCEVNLPAPVAVSVPCLLQPRRATSADVVCSFMRIFVAPISTQGGGGGTKPFAPELLAFHQSEASKSVGL